ncbi:glycosyltransferase family 39 protein [Candidatus Roizmanbacteria bacterium]|nr:glycosyltransferase family 39 protein [Candidatus Gottesmanbacteria bacterium]MBI5123166.1 glycosyltransferase family 39 protein [Candidatus Roizmanbacteria bacterium]
MQKYLPITLLILILFLGAFFRLYRISEYMTFLGDEGRDVLVVKRILVDHKFTLLGPTTSVGSMYMGPIYYYFTAPFLWITNLDPVGPAIMVALFGIATIGLLYYTGAGFFHPTVGLVAAFLYAISPLPISYGKSSWNPNIVPFFALLIIFSLLQVVVRKKYGWFPMAGASLGILFQLHYVTFMFIPILLVCLSIIRFRIPIKHYFASIFALILTYSPFLLFELRHQFVNTQAVIRFVTEQKRDQSIPFILSFWQTISDVFVRLFWRLVVLGSAELTKIFILILLVVLFFYWKKIGRNNTGLKIILSWWIVGILSFGLYRGVIYDYYFGSLFTLPYLLTGILIYYLWSYKKVTKTIAVIILLTLTYFNLKNSPLRIEPNNMLKNTQTISRFVFEKAENKPYNFALIAGRNSDHAYRYFLEVWGNKPEVLENEVNDPQRKSVTDRLLVICEEKVCQPLGHPLWEIAGFGRAEIVGEWQVSTAKVFLLEHYNKS